MKKICLNCGEKIISSTRKKFCSTRCNDKFQHKLKPLSVKHDFETFQIIVAASDTPDEFQSLYKKYFTQEKIR